MLTHFFAGAVARILIEILRASLWQNSIDQWISRLRTKGDRLHLLMPKNFPNG